MTHDSTWLGRTRAKRAKQVAAPFGLLLACILLASFASTAYAIPYDMRGEWSVEYKSAHEPALSEIGVINQMNNATGAFSGTFRASIGLESSFEGTLSGTTASITSVTPSPFGTITFIASSTTVDTVKNTLSGSGIYYTNGKETEPGEITGVRLKTYQEVEERLAREQREKEEAEARANVRGEWSITLESGPEKVKGIALITEQANGENKFASKSALFESVIGGTFSGTLEGNKAKVTITTEGSAALSLPPGTFTSETIVVSTSSNPTSMTGSGKLKLGELELPGTLTATRIRSYGQIEEQEAKEREAREKVEEEARTAKEKVEREAKEKREREAREALEKASKTPPTTMPLVESPKSLVPVLLATKTSTASHSGGLSLKLTNPNGASVSGHLKLTFTSQVTSAEHTTGNRKSKTSTLGEASFSIAPAGSQVVKLTLTKSGRTELVHLKTMHVLVTVTTQVDGRPTITKVYGLTLRSGSTHHKG
ncbi:MAG TPA: hypothetical protein VK701_05855 [Solirubrobacteraceae bacterium]|jgi:hypothetical protein|nr:hypothetical protein [Solirubrobacteraceae bacterium]